MPENVFKTCVHSKEPTDWRKCLLCVDEIMVGYVIAKTYLREIAEGEFNANGDLFAPVQEQSLRGRDAHQIARTALSVM